MNWIVDPIVFWKDLITKVFADQPLAAALVTVVAIVTFFVLDKADRGGKRPQTVLVLLLGWVILVPPVGWVFTLLGKIWAFLEKALPVATDALGSFYKIYERHPLLVLVLITLGVVTYFLWRKFRPAILPNRTVRIISLAVAVFVIAHIASPVAEWVAPVGSPSAEKDAKAKQPELPAPKPSAPAPLTAANPVSSTTASGASPAVTPPSAQPVPEVAKSNTPSAASQPSK